MSESDEEAATQLATAAIECVRQMPRPSDAYFDEVFVSLNPSAQVITRAMCIAAARLPGYTIVQTLLNAYLQHKLTQEHAAAQARMARTTTFLTMVIVVLTIVTIIVPFVPHIQPQKLAVAWRIVMLHIANPFVYWGYCLLAVIGSVWYGRNAVEIFDFKPAPERGGAQRIHQFWFNAIGAAIGWLAGSVVIVPRLRVQRRAKRVDDRACCSGLRRHHWASAAGSSVAA
jgi:hypothetical protein